MFALNLKPIALSLSIKRKQEQVLMTCLYKKRKKSVSFHYDMSTTESTVQFQDISHIFFEEGLQIHKDIILLCKCLLKAIKRQNDQFMLYKFEIWCLPLEIALHSVRIQSFDHVKIYWEQLQLMQQLSTGQYAGKVLGIEKVSSLTIQIYKINTKMGGWRFLGPSVLSRTLPKLFFALIRS